MTQRVIDRPGRWTANEPVATGAGTARGSTTVPLPGTRSGRLRLPASASPDEIAAVTAAVAAAVADEPHEADRGAPARDRPAGVEAWTAAGRYAATGRRPRCGDAPAGVDGWSLAARTRF